MELARKENLVADYKLAFANDFMQKKSEDKRVRYASIATSTATLISAHNVCHSLCLGLIAFLAAFGIVLTGMPLAFLQDYNIYFWTMAFITMVIMLIMIFKN